MSEFQEKRAIRVLIVDDHPMVREGTRAQLESNPVMSVVGVAGEGIAAVRMARELRPDVVLLDVHLPDISGVEVVRQLSRDPSEIAVVVITGYDDIGYARALVELGIRGYLAKSASGTEIIRAIEAVAAGQMVLTAAGARGLTGGAGVSLTLREREVLELLVAGCRNAEIAEQLRVTLKTVEYHVRNVLEKLGARSRSEAVSISLRRGYFLADQSTR